MFSTAVFRTRSTIAAMIIAAVAITTCAYAFQGTSTSGNTPKPAVIIHITCGPEEIFRVMAAMHMAEDAINSRRRVVLFFNDRGVTIPLKRLMNDVRLGDERPLWVVLDDLSKSGAQIVVARESARVLGLADSEFLPQTYMGDNGGQIFAKVNSNTVVFSY